MRPGSLPVPLVVGAYKFAKSADAVCSFFFVDLLPELHAIIKILAKVFKALTLLKGMASIGSIQTVAFLVTRNAILHAVLGEAAEKARRDSRVGQKQGHEAKEGKLGEEVHDAKDGTKSKKGMIRVSTLLQYY